ncbi:MAG: DUF4097 family beta strand repeat protein [Lachnospiraceae bacterium]|nr:DUF4097 family beta strand repeat protein [Lachnospiraceae bacterium]
MKNKKSAWVRLIVSSVLALTFIGVLIVGLVGNSFPFSLNFSLFPGQHYANSDRYTAGSGSITADYLKKIDIDWLDGSVTISTYEGNTIEIEETCESSLKQSEQVHYYYHDGTLDIQYRESGFFFNFFPKNYNKELTIRIPENLASQLDYISTDAVSADINMKGLTTKELTSDTVSGGIAFYGFADEIEGDTVSGDFRYTFTSTPKEVEFDSVSGDITLTLPPDANFESEYDTVSGDFHCDFPTTNRGDTVVRNTDEQGAKKGDFEFDTVSGDVHILQNK